MSKATDEDVGYPQYVRPDGVIMGYNPYAPEMIEKYGAPGNVIFATTVVVG